MIAERPRAPVEVPSSVAGIVGDRPATAIWRNEIGGLTFAVGQPVAFYLKWQPKNARAETIDLPSEAARMRWVRPYLTVPEPLELGDNDQGSWMTTRALDGRSAVDDRWKADPGRAVRAVGAGLRRLHDRAPAGDCPFSWLTADRLAVARNRLDRGDLAADKVVGPVPEIEAGEAVAFLEANRPDDDPVVCHGDACAPNTLLDDKGDFLALVDLGALGVGHRWADLAIATWSTAWNYGPGWEAPLLDEYGIEPDAELLRYFRLLWDVGP